MPQAFPLTGFHHDFISLHPVSFPESIIEEILIEIFYPNHELDQATSCSTILNLSTFTEPLSLDAAMDALDEFRMKRWRKERQRRATVKYGLQKMYREYNELKPTCVLVLGELCEELHMAAKKFAQMTLRVHLDVIDLLNDEMSKGSQCGKWIYSNFCEGRCIPVLMVYRLVKIAISQMKLQNMGYVLTGFPIIPKVVCTLDKLPRPLREFEELKSPPEDVIEKWRKRKRDESKTQRESMFHVQSGISFSATETTSKSYNQPELTEISPSSLLSSKIKSGEPKYSYNAKMKSDHRPLRTDQLVEEDSDFDDIMNQPVREKELEATDVILALRHQLNFLLLLELDPDLVFYIHNDYKNPEGVSIPSEGYQCKYDKSVSREIERFLLHFHHENVRVLYTSLSVEETLKQFLSVVSLVDSKYPLVPERMIFDEEDEAKLSKLSLPEALLFVSKYKCIQPNLPWALSDVGMKCPVLLQRGKLQDGKLECAVKYIGQMFFCSSDSARNTFLEDPYKYCSAIPNCRVAIIKSASRQSNGIMSVYQKLFNAKPFRWRDVVSRSPEVAKMDIHKEAGLWAESRVKQYEVKYARTYDAVNFFKTIKTWKEYQRTSSLQQPYNLRRATAGPTDMLFQDVYRRLLEFKFYQLYKERYAANIAEIIITWLQTLDERTHSKDSEKYAQWVLEDVPTHLEFWEKMEQNGFLPDIVLFLSDSFDTKSLHQLPAAAVLEDVQSRCDQIAFTFPSLINNCNWDLAELVSRANHLDEESVGITFIEDFSTESEDSQIDNIEYPFERIIDFLQSRKIPVLISEKTGHGSTLMIVENYLNLFKQQPLQTSKGQLEEISKICEESYPKEPELPSKLFPDLRAKYTLESKFLQKDVKLEYDEFWKYYETVSMAEGEEDSEDEGDTEDDYSLDIGSLSKANLESMKELEVLRQLPLGRSNFYCPVSLRDKKCLRLGRLSLAAIHHSNYYCMSTPEALAKFTNCALPYTFEDIRPRNPPLRVFVIGPAGANRTNFMEILSEKLPIKPVSYSKMMAEYLQGESVASCMILNSDNENFEIHGRRFLQTAMKNKYREGIVCEGFPNTVMQLRGMLHNKIFPEVVYFVDENPNDALRYAFSLCFINWQLQMKYNAYFKKLRHQLARKPQTVVDHDNKIDDSSIRESLEIMKEFTTVKQRLKQYDGDVKSNDYSNVSEETVLSSFENKKKFWNNKELSDQKVILEDIRYALSSPDNRSVVEMGEIDDNSERSMQTDAEIVKQARSILKATKKDLKEQMLEIKKVIRILISEKIPVITIPMQCTQRNLDIKLKRFDPEALQNRFEQVIIVSPYTAPILLSSGYAIYSHFKNFCPVDAQQLMPINRYFSMKNQKKLYAVLYHRHLFYINGPENLIRFCTNPISYTSNENPVMLILPIRILVLGPTCSGVTTLCERISFEFNFKIIGNNHLNNFLRNERTNKGLKSAHNSFESSRSVSLVKFLRLHLNDSPSGFVLDNLPVLPEDLINVAYANMNIHMVFIVNCEFWSIWRNWRSSYLQNEPYKYISIPDELARLYSSFKKYRLTLRKYQNYGRDIELFNIIYLKNTSCKWNLWEETRNYMLISLRDVASYIHKLPKRQVVRIGHLNIYQAEFERRLSPIKQFCPVCWNVSKRLVKYRHDFYNVGVDFYGNACQYEFNLPFGYKNNGLYQKYFSQEETVSTERKPITSKNMLKPNLVQYSIHFYWTCDKHHIDILLNGPNFLPPDPMSLPAYIPFLVTNYFRKDVVNDGFCTVTFLRHPTKRVYTLGDPNYAVFYRGKIFLCASANCALDLLENPEYYYDCRIPAYEPPYVELDLNNFQINYGHLTPEMIIEALKALAQLRPKHLALNIRDSSAIFIGLYLKTINPVSRAQSKQINKELYLKFVSECKNLKWLISNFNQKGNPHISQK